MAATEGRERTGAASAPRVGAVIIGRDEGDRLVACLASVAPQVDRLVYVDSGSRDASVANARAAGAEVVELDMSLPFTAARARNAGFAALDSAPGLGFIQFVDGDCIVSPGWISAAVDRLAAAGGLGVVCGRLRERFPEASVYNRLCDWEWDLPAGPAQACGGVAMFRAEAFRAVGGFNPHLVAGEEPELCLRLRRGGWRVERTGDAMALHDAAMTRFGQWWRRSRRTGYAYAEGAMLHGSAPERHYVRETRRALAWGAVLPVATILGAAISPWAWTLLLAWPAQVARLALRDGGHRQAWDRAFFLTLGKLSEAAGAIAFYLRRAGPERRADIEHK